MNRQYITKHKLPDSPGVYFFCQDSKVLYAGRATSLRDRTRSYFSPDLIMTRGQLIVDMVKKANNIKFQKTDSVLEAIILEANLIKKYQPRYNTDEKDDKSFNYVVITKGDYPQIIVTRERNLKLQTAVCKPLIKFGPFPNGGALAEALKFIRKIFPYRDAKCIAGNGRPCFNRYIGLCPGTCTGEITKSDYSKTVKYIIQIFQGRKQSVIKGLEKEMKQYAKTLEFEKAAIIKRKLSALKHIRDIAFIKKDKTEISGNLIIGKRIEAYDVAHLAGKNTRGAMVVMENGELIKKDYRVFTIREAKGGDDLGALSEVLNRRLKHPEWQFPDIAVVDGGQGQFNTAQFIINKISPKTLVVSVVKDDKHKAREILGSIGSISKNDILRLNIEAHRFVIAKYRKAERRNLYI